MTHRSSPLSQNLQEALLLHSAGNLVGSDSGVIFKQVSFTPPYKVLEYRGHHVSFYIYFLSSYLKSPTNAKVFTAYFLVKAEKTFRKLKLQNTLHSSVRLH